MGKNSANAQPNLQGVRLWNQKDILGAEKSFLVSIKRNPENDAGYGFLTGFYLEQGEIEKARSTLKKWKEETPLRFRASYHMMWARLLSLEHNKQSALFHLKAAIDAGFDNDDIILKDPKLEYVRDTPEFWELVCWGTEKMQKTAETMLLFST